MQSQSGSKGDPLEGTQSIGDTVMKADQAAPSTSDAVPNALGARRTPIHIVYMHGINQVGPGDSALLRHGICKYLGECNVVRVDRFYADKGEFALDHAPPDLEYMQTRIWRTPEEWHASAPFFDRYEISGNGHTPIVLDEINWWPVVYPLKCKWLIARDALLTGPSDDQINICSVFPTGTQMDPDHPGRFLNYAWLSLEQARELKRKSRHASFANRGLKNGLMDWGFSDAVMALGPIQKILIKGIRQLLQESLRESGVNPETANPTDAGPEFFFVTHSLGSFLGLIALDPDHPDPQLAEFPGFAMSTEEKAAADYFAAHTSSFYFLANQVSLIELARIYAPPLPIPPEASSGTPSEEEKPRSIMHWLEKRKDFLAQHRSLYPIPQIIAWSDPDDLLTWNVPRIKNTDIKVVNLHVCNSGFKLPPFLVWPTGAHDNYARNKKVLQVILKHKKKKD